MDRSETKAAALEGDGARRQLWPVCLHCVYQDLEEDAISLQLEVTDD